MRGYGCVISLNSHIPIVNILHFHINTSIILDGNTLHTNIFIEVKLKYRISLFLLGIYLNIHGTYIDIGLTCGILHFDSGTNHIKRLLRNKCVSMCLIVLGVKR